MNCLRSMFKQGHYQTQIDNEYVHLSKKQHNNNILVPIQHVVLVTDTSSWRLPCWMAWNNRTGWSKMLTSGNRCRDMCFFQPHLLLNATPSHDKTAERIHHKRMQMVHMYPFGCPASLETKTASPRQITKGRIHHTSVHLAFKEVPGWGYNGLGGHGAMPTKRFYHATGSSKCCKHATKKKVICFHFRFLSTT